MTQRREFIKKSIIGAGAFALAPLAQLKAKDKSIELGLISNTLSNEFKNDYKAALRDVAKIGYTHIESSVPKAAKSAEEFKAAIDASGMKSIGTGASMGNYLDDFEGKVKVAATLGCQYLICYYPWMSSAENLKMDEVLETTDRINQIGKKAKDAGFRFAWHNHAKEFVDIDHRQAFDILMENTDPEYSTVQLDWFWVTEGGRDPIELFKKYPGRFELAHLRDQHNSRHGGSACPGQGLIDFEPIIKAARKTGGTKYFIVEHPAQDGIECARVSYEYLSKIM